MRATLMSLFVFLTLLSSTSWAIREDVIYWENIEKLNVWIEKHNRWPAAQSKGREKALSHFIQSSGGKSVLVEHGLITPLNQQKLGINYVYNPPVNPIKDLNNFITRTGGWPTNRVSGGKRRLNPTLVRWVIDNGGPGYVFAFYLTPEARKALKPKPSVVTIGRLLEALPRETSSFAVLKIYHEVFHPHDMKVAINTLCREQPAWLKFLKEQIFFGEATSPGVALRNYFKPPPSLEDLPTLQDPAASINRFVLARGGWPLPSETDLFYRALYEWVQDKGGPAFVYAIFLTEEARNALRIKPGSTNIIRAIEALPPTLASMTILGTFFHVFKKESLMSAIRTVYDNNGPWQALIKSFADVDKKTHPYRALQRYYGLSDCDVTALE